MAYPTKDSVKVHMHLWTVRFTMGALMYSVDDGVHDLINTIIGLFAK